jgi:FkbM family methyltransferase
MMLNITNRRITNFCSFLFEQDKEAEKIGFVDVGSGGKLKEPWSLIPAETITKFNFEPTADGGTLPLCISNKSGMAQFFVAFNERDSSFHQPRADFVDRYAFDDMLTKKTISVEVTSLDEYFSGRYESIDAIDINVEGHDFQVLQGASHLLDAGTIKLLKVEFELVQAYEGQGYFSDIDALLRGKDFRLAGIEIEYVHPITCRNVFFGGEPLWGKALYAPNIAAFTQKLTLAKAKNQTRAKREMAAAISLYMSAKLPSYAYDVIDVALANGLISQPESLKLGMRVAECFRWAKFEEGLSRFTKLWISLWNVIRR